MRCLVVLALAGCGGTTKPASSGPSQPPYLALLQHGQRWSLPIQTVNGEHRGDAWVQTTTEHGALTCEVADVQTIADATMSHVQCAPPYAGLLVVGYWVATPVGLYHPALPVDDTDELTLLGENDLLLTAKPKEREHSQATTGMQHAIEAFRFKQSWCMRDTVVAEEDRRHFTLCVDASGMTGGGELVVSSSDHSWHRSTFGAVADDPDDPTTGHDD